ncbi:MAG: GMC family oxidoreductase [Vicinamibacterales bacterium]|nr:GMC family oxidoreductase [Vicinamibacterales bacterium]
MPDRYDVIIIGTGAGGGTLAHRLAPTGKRILLLERGDYLPREKANWDPAAVFGQSRYKAEASWLDGDGTAFHPGTHYCVGGNTKVYGAALFRMREQDFGEVRHHGGISPAWPFTYADLAPYYDEAEQLYHVHGQRGADPTEPPSGIPYPWPAVRHEPRIQELSDALEGLGHRPFPLPLGLRLDEDDPPGSPCIKCDTCDGFPCLLHAKADAEVVCVQPALAYANVTLRTGRRVERLETSASGREVIAVHAVHDGEPETYRGDIVVVSCGAINSAALLLRSASAAHPRGLANRSDVVGRHYMAHLNSALVALSVRPNPTRFQKTLGLNDFYFGSDDWDYPLGHLQMLGKSHAAMFRADAPRLTPDLVLEKMAAHALDFWLTSEDLPDPANRVTLEPDGTVRLTYRANNTAGHARLVARLKAMLGDIGCRNWLIPCSAYLGKQIPLAGVAHQNGTIRFGTDAGSSALDVHCRAHDVDNLYVVDASFFASSSAVNPGLTIMANALRVGDHLKARLV